MVCMSHQALQGLHTCTLKKNFLQARQRATYTRTLL